MAWDQVIRGQHGDLHEVFLSEADCAVAWAICPVRLPTCAGRSRARRVSFLARAARHFARLRGQGAPASARKARIALLSSTTTIFIAPLLRLACFRDGIDAEVYTAAYGNFRQEILNPSSGLYAFKPDFVIIATHWRDANLPAFSSTPGPAVAQVVNDFQQLWERSVDAMTVESSSTTSICQVLTPMAI